MSLIQSNSWTAAGKLPNPGKNFCLQFAAVNDFNRQRDENGISYARNAMILCGMALNTNGKWGEEQFQRELQNIINKYRSEFENPEQYLDVFNLFFYL